MSDFEIEVNDYSEEYLKALDKAVLRGVYAMAIQAEKYASMKAPVDTGRLRASITFAVDEDEKAAYIGTNVEYAPYVEMGTSKTKAQPFLKPAATEHTAEYKAMMEESLRNV